MSNNRSDFHMTIERLTDCDLETSQKIKQHYMNFLKYNEQFSQFVEDHKFIKGYEEIKQNDFYSPNRNTIMVINDWIQLLESRKQMVDPDAVVIKFDQSIQLPKIVMDQIIKYPVKDIKGQFLGEDSHFIDIKQTTSELKSGVSQQSDLDTSILRLDKQDSITTTILPNQDDLEQFSIFNTNRMSDENPRLKFGKTFKNQIKMLENATQGFCKDLFSAFKNEYSSSFNKNSKYITQQIYNNKFEKCSFLEQYFEKSFQNTVSFMINERMTTQFDANIKELPQFVESIFQAFKNDYSVIQPMYYTFDDSKIKFQPEQIKQKQMNTDMNVHSVYTIEGMDASETSNFLATMMEKNKHHEEPVQQHKNEVIQEEEENQLIQLQKDYSSPLKTHSFSGKELNNYQYSPQDQNENLAFVPSPDTAAVKNEKEKLRESKELNYEEELVDNSESKQIDIPINIQDLQENIYNKERQDFKFQELIESISYSDSHQNDNPTEIDNKYH